MGKHSEAGRMAMTYPVFIERTDTGYSAYVPDLPGYIAAAETLEELRALVREGIPFHIEGLRLHGEPVPSPSSVEFVEVA
jgi:predicted RNase H-like HicB family nuclease